MQLLFQRGNQYLTLACRSIRTALHALEQAKRVREEALSHTDCDDDKATRAMQGSEPYKNFVQARETVRKYAKRAQRDYITFFSKLDYAHAPQHPANEDLFARDPIVDDLDDFEPPSRRYAKEKDGSTSTALTRRSNDDHRRSRHSSEPPPPLSIYEMSSLVSTSPPANLPPFPPPANCESYDDETLTYHPLLPETLHSFLLTHCLLQTDATTLLRHSYNVARLVRLADGYPFFLAARSPARADWAEIMRKTHNWVGLSKSWEQLCKLAPPSSPKSDAANRKSLTNGSDHSHQHKSLATRTKEAAKKDNPARKRGESIDQKKDRIHKEAVMDALGDERVVDDETFHRAVQAREMRAWRDSIEEATQEHTNGTSNGHKAIEANGHDQAPDAPVAPTDAVDVAVPNGTPGKQINGTDKAEMSTVSTTESPKPSPKSASSPISLTKRESSVAKDEEYLIGTERAEAIALWIQQAPAPSAVDTSSLPGKKRRTKTKKKTPAAGAGSNGTQHEAECETNGHADGAEEEIDD